MLEVVSREYPNRTAIIDAETNEENKEAYTELYNYLLGVRNANRNTDGDLSVASPGCDKSRLKQSRENRQAVLSLRHSGCATHLTPLVVL